MRKFLEYAVTEGKTVLSGPELTRRFSDIDGRLHVLEELKVGWEAAVIQVQNHGLERINNVLQPLLDQARTEIDAMGVALADILATWQGDHAAILADWQTIAAGWAAMAGDFAALQAQAADHESRLAALASQIEAWDTRPRSIAGLLPDPKEPPDYDVTYGAVRFPNARSLGWGHFEAWLDGQAWAISLEGMMSTAQSATLGLLLLYQVVGPGSSAEIVKDRRWGFTSYSAGQRVQADNPNGFVHQAIVAGTTGGGSPNWPTIIGQTMVDGTVTWQCVGPGFTTVNQFNTNPPASAHTRFDIAGLNLRIPAGKVAVGDRVHFCIWRSGADTHSGDLLVNDIWVAPVEM